MGSSPDGGAAGAGVASRHAHVSADGVRLHHEEHGSGAPILCIHGTAAPRSCWSDADRALARLGRVIAYDRRGCARSERPEPYERTSVAEHADDAAALLDALGAAPAVVIGRSYGGTVALDLALRHPDRVRALVVLEGDAPRELAPATAAWIDALAARLRAVAGRAGVDAVAEALIDEVAGGGRVGRLPEELRRILTANGPAILAELAGEWWLEADAAALADDRAARAAGGRRRLAARAARATEALARVLPNARTVQVGGGHLIDPAAPEVLAFVEEVLGELCPDEA